MKHRRASAPAVSVFFRLPSTVRLRSTERATRLRQEKLSTLLVAL